MPETNKISSNDFLAQILDSIKLLNDLTTRLDERVKIVVEKQGELQREVDHLSALMNSVKERIAIVERNDDAINNIKVNHENYGYRIVKLETTASQSEGRWQKITNFAIQIVYVVVSCYLLWKLELGNISTPP